MNPKIDSFLSRATNWHDEMEKLRKILLSCDLTEELKWGKPCYSHHGKNIVIIQGFKDYCALLFFKGYLLSDPEGVLVKTGQNTVVGRQMRFTDAKTITKLAPVIKAYIYEAIEAEEAGIKADVKKEALPIPEELRSAFSKNTKLKTSFQALTPGRQNAYIFYFSQPKQSKTRTARIEKYIPYILQGKGMNDDFISKRK
ncbi:Uncharacterized conserved protein YdeI, YjbR/CyaY-like superfamily, DUF1801 family [Chitinophaga terrae (ex Kim and Jung 2007)]|uniref:Uncharacterized conserved protein YdeI, YjbR/CyaY-like superfamily, DUF1801 family n=1 Tax=Chitinophaga terrae (ex Kim and Jung 2007) TaxID=408074 RepID=A0A1H4D237_9BACT|nr:DUF1801 domain-containing protein [Chitinophaga terrae (ex Kim and Jung 2007)]MDQ0108430.1 uncharacterized protein YdeI (YjbR/CyaY-like superfamily) [Chitinophaga terrae (ex Kim and Jung 2007)]GEP90600.1 hypothetical protein CTE07_22450 [Chitinophaga terrae (ex Kim and Jung 2007)]SEA66774.1 Uncharacterized conserved protein YdeI, YjbR/CyaY-like superfamily, DUF1801 family [Chitinophaga terrae (ex Kim and Jung 2007)]